MPDDPPVPDDPSVPDDPTLPPVPQADRHVLALHALHYRQLRTAFLHGRSRSWRDSRRIWPAALVGLAIVALVIAGAGVVAAFERQQRLDAAAVQSVAGAEA